MQTLTGISLADVQAVYDGAEGDKPQTATIPVPVQAPVMTAGTGRAGKPLAPSLGRAVISSGRRH